MPERGLIGLVEYGKTLYFRGPYAGHTTSSQFSVEEVDALPRVDIIYIYEGVGGDLIEAAVEAGAKGIASAGVGNGNMTDAVEALARVAGKGVVCVRSSRVPTGFVGRNVEIDDDERGFVASFEHSPQKARVLLRLALLEGRDPAEIQGFFARY